MDKSILRQYIDIKMEIADTERRILEEQEKVDMLESDTASDHVKGGAGGKKHFHIEGFSKAYKRHKTKLQYHRLKREKRIAELETLADDIEDSIRAVEDAETRRILAFRYIDGMTWQQVAMNMGEGYTPDACRIKHQRFTDKE